MKHDIVTTRHPHLLTVARERGWLDPGVPVIEHAKVSDIKGKHVFGVLPYHLGQHTASMTEVPMALTIEDRAAMQRGDLSLERTREIAGYPRTYEVFGGSELERGWAIAKAHDRHRDGYSARDLLGMLQRSIAEYALGAKLWHGRRLTDNRAVLAAACISMAGQSSESGPVLDRHGELRRGFADDAMALPWSGTYEWTGDGNHAGARLDCDRWTVQAYASGPGWTEVYRPGI